MKSAIKQTRVISGHGSNDADNFTTTDNLYLLSSVEVFGSDDYDTAAGTTHQLEYYNNSSNSNKQYNSSNSLWWLRSANSDNNSSFRGIYGNGFLVHNSATNTDGVAPAFRIG